MATGAPRPIPNHVNYYQSISRLLLLLRKSLIIISWTFTGLARTSEHSIEWIELKRGRLLTISKAEWNTSTALHGTMIGDIITQRMTRDFLKHKIVGLIATRQVGDTGGPEANTMMTSVKRTIITSKRRKEMLHLNSAAPVVGQVRSEFLSDEALGEDKGIDHHVPLSPDRNGGLFLHDGLIKGTFTIRKMMIIISGGQSKTYFVLHSGTSYGAALVGEMVLNSTRSIINPDNMIYGELRLQVNLSLELGFGSTPALTKSPECPMYCSGVRFLFYYTDDDLRSKFTTYLAKLLK